MENFKLKSENFNVKLKFRVFSAQSFFLAKVTTQTQNITNQDRECADMTTLTL